MSRYQPCESTEGEWGKPCPACGAMLPSVPKPMTTWQAARNRDEGRSERAAWAAPAALRIKNQPSARAHRRAA